MADAYLDWVAPWTAPLPLPWRNGVVTLGNFDGVHRGHRDLLRRARELAGEAGKVIAATFDPHPRALLKPGETGPPLLTLERKACKLREAGADLVVVFRIDPDFLKITARAFFDRIIVQALGAAQLIEGGNFCFGQGREGTMAVLAEYCREKGMGLETHPGLQADGQWISTSRIRELIEKGDVVGAAHLLGSPAEMTGSVITGAQRGRTLGFPTANLDAPGQLAPKYGVYAARAILPEGSAKAAAVHLGPNPTFGESTPKIEAHLLDFQGDLYGKVLRLEFLERLRDPRPFESVEALKQQLDRDVSLARKLYERASPHPHKELVHDRCDPATR